MEVKRILNHVFWLTVCGAIIASISLDKIYLMVFKAIGVLSLCAIYLLYNKTNKNTKIYVLGVFLTIVGETMIICDFTFFKKAIYITFTLFYLSNIALILPEAKKVEFKQKQFFSFPLLLGTMLLVYLSITVIPMVYPQLIGMELYLAAILIALIGLNYICFYRYFNKPDLQGLWLLTLAFSYVFLNVIVPINYMYYYSDSIIITINIMEIASHYFLLKFMLSETEQNYASSEIFIE